MRKLDVTLIIAVVIAIASPAMAKDVKSSSSSSLLKHSVTGAHYKEGQITAKKTSKPTVHDISVTKKQDSSSAK
jgi:hypothetical protein